MKGEKMTYQRSKIWFILAGLALLLLITLCACAGLTSLGTVLVMRSQLPPTTPMATEPAAPVVVTATPEQTPTLTVAPTAPPPSPTATVMAPPALRALTYDRTDGKTLAPGQTVYVADLINEMIFAKVIKGENVTQKEVETVVKIIQIEAERVGAEVHEGASLDLPSDRAWLVWISNSDYSTRRPSDVSDVLGPSVPLKGRIWIQTRFDPNVSPRVLKRWESSGTPYWAVTLW